MMLKSLLAFLLCTTIAFSLEGKKPTVTIISGFWNVGRGELDSGFKRTTEYYLRYFETHLQTETNMIIFGDQSLRKFVKEKRNHPNTLFILKDLESFEKQWHTKKIIKIIDKFKTQPVWNDYKKFPQYGLNMYNPVVMSKLFLMAEAMEQDIFESDFYAWADAGILHNFGNQLGGQYVSKKVFESFHYLYQGPWYFHYYKDKNMFRGFGMGQKRYVSKNIPSNEMVLANYFGGRIEVVSTMKSVYENFLRITLEYEDLGTDQSIFSIMLVRYPLLIPLVNKVQVIDLMRKQKIQSKHYLSVGKHRIFKMKTNGKFEFEELSVRKDTKIKFSFSKNANQSQKISQSTHSLVPQYRIPPLLSQKPINYKIVLLHRLLFAAGIFGLYYSLVRAIYSFKFIRY